MIKWFAYIVLLLIIAPALLSAKEKGNQYTVFYDRNLPVTTNNYALKDTLASAKNSKRQQEPDDKKKIKEIAKAKRQPKPEKIETGDGDAKKTKPKRQRRPEGMERPPEIPRRSGD